ncbi:hypothetical protein AMECASPLE_001418 [Ameca splendens]|uniref:Uncharacterized protein n=1 Tax=Ameca splendens TaxID=208324 RepID=A0ABV0YKD4_9TELE
MRGSISIRGFKTNTRNETSQQRCLTEDRFSSTPHLHPPAADHLTPLSSRMTCAPWEQSLSHLKNERKLL